MPQQKGRTFLVAVTEGRVDVSVPNAERKQRSRFCTGIVVPAAGVMTRTRDDGKRVARERKERREDVCSQEGVPEEREKRKTTEPTADTKKKKIGTPYVLPCAKPAQRKVDILAVDIYRNLHRWDGSIVRREEEGCNRKHGFFLQI